MIKKIRTFIQQVKKTNNVGKTIVMAICVLVFIASMIIKACNISIKDNKLSLIETISQTLSLTLYITLSLKLTINISDSYNSIQNNFYFGNISLDSPIANAYKASHRIYIISSRLLVDLNTKTVSSNNLLSIDQINKMISEIIEKKNFIDVELSVFGSGKRFKGKEEDCFKFLTYYSSLAEALINLGTYSTADSYQNDIVKILEALKEKYENKKVAPLEE